MMRVLFGSEKGATLVEAAVALPIVLVLLFGVIDGARFVAAQNSVNTAAHESARYGSSVGIGPSGDFRFVECDEIRGAGVDVSAGTITASQITVEYDKGPSTAIVATCPAGGPGPESTTVRDGDRVVITVTRSFDPVSPLVGSLFGPFNITSTSHRSILSP